MYVFISLRSLHSVNWTAVVTCLIWVFSSFFSACSLLLTSASNSTHLRSSSWGTSQRPSSCPTLTLWGLLSLYRMLSFLSCSLPLDFFSSPSQCLCSKHADPVCILSWSAWWLETLVRTRPNDSCTPGCFWTGSVWLKSDTVSQNQIRSRVVLCNVIWAIYGRMDLSLKVGNW